MTNRRNMPGSRDMGRGYGRGYDRSQGGYGSSINPWQAGTNPGSRGSYNGDMGGHLGSLMPGSNLGSYGSQMSNANDQWALANNIINLLRNNNSQQVPSLLDLAPAPMMNSRMMGPGPAMSRFDERNSRRIQPYKMNRGNPSSNRNRPQDQGNRNNASPNKARRDNRNKNQTPVGKNTTKVGSAKKKAVPNSQEKKAVTEGAKREDSETEGAEKKRDWKDEKKNEAGEEDEIVKTPKNKDKKNKAATRFAGISSEYLYCHICKKNMWDGISFENHLKGRAHILMTEGVNEGYRIKCDLIRQECRIIEKAKEIELKRLKWSGKKVNTYQEYCTMCDLQFVGQLSVHRRSEGHKNLKKFLHPKCFECNKEFPTRSEWDEHLLSISHLRKASEKGKATGKGAKKRQVDFKLRTEAEELEDIMQAEAEMKVDKAAAESKAAEKTEETKAEGTEENPVTEETEMDTTETGEVATEPEGTEEEIKKEDDTIVEFSEDLDLSGDIKSRLPKYSTKQSIGLSFICELKCYECKLCFRYFETENASKIHARSSIHHENFVKMLNAKSEELKALARKQAAAEESKTDDEGNWKRRKVVTDEGEADIDADDDSKIDEDALLMDDDDTSKIENGTEKYDPAQVLDDDETKHEELDVSKDDSVWDEVNDKIDDILQTVANDADKEEVAVETLVTPEKVEEKTEVKSGKLPEAVVVINDIEERKPEISPSKPTPTATPRGGRARRARGSARGRY